MGVGEWVEEHPHRGKGEEEGRGEEGRFEETGRRWSGERWAGRRRGNLYGGISFQT